MWEVDAGRFFRLVPHLYVYGGAVAARVSVSPLQAEGVPPVSSPQPAPQGVSVPAGAREIRASAAELRMSDIGDVFSVGSAGV